MSDSTPPPVPTHPSKGRPFFYGMVVLSAIVILVFLVLSYFLVRHNGHRMTPDAHPKSGITTSP